MTRIQVTDSDLSVVAGPTYTENTEDGPSTRYDYFVVYHNRQKDGLTWGDDERFHSQLPAERAMQKILKHGSINPEKWDKGDPWWDYHRGMSLEERHSPFGLAWQEEQEQR